jgi:transglutaminase superfamily protein
MRRAAHRRRMFWEAFNEAYPVKATALLLVAALAVVSCGKEGSLSRALSKLNYDSLPAKAPRPTKPAEKLHVAVTDLNGLLAVQARRGLSNKQAEHARAARAQIATQLHALERQFGADRIKLAKLGGAAALARLGTIQKRTAGLERSLQATLGRVPSNGARAAVPAAQATKLLAALSPEKPQQPLSSNLGFGIRNANPRPASLSAGISPAYNSPTPTEPASDLPRTPEPADLAETPETKVTPAIHELAQQLGGDPVKIYGYVHNNIRYQPYYGIRKGADQTLAEKSGSDADQAALLIALLRDSGIHARFVQGTAELPAARAANWLGVDPAAGQHLDAAPDILASGGVPTTQVRANGQLVKVRFDHVWAEAYVPNDAYRGTEEGLGGKTWLPLDPSIKENEFTHPAADFQALLKPAVEDWAHGFIDGSQKVGDYGIVAPPSDQTAVKTQALLDHAKAVLADHGVGDGSKLDKVVGGTQIKSVADTYLPSSTPFRARVVSGELRTLPPSLNASVSVTVSGADPLSQPSSNPDDANAAGFTFTAPTDELANKRVTLAYVPATDTDAQIIDAYHGLLNAPTYAAALIPVLRVDGRVVARGHQAVSTGYTQNLEITYRMPGYAADVVQNPLYVGSLSALALALGPTSSAQLKARAERFAQLASDTTPANLLTDARAGEMLSILGSYYFARNDQFDGIAAQGTGIDSNRLLSGGIVASGTGVSYIAGFPVFARFSGFYVDVDEDAHSVVSKTGDAQVQSGYLRAAGIHASSSEGAIFSQTLGGRAVSTAEVMRDAMARGATVLKIDASNVARLDELAHVSADVKQEISRAVNERGATVLIPESETTIGGWTGVGYIIDEGSTVDYRISGGLNGGVIGATLADAATSLHDWATRVLPCLLALDHFADAVHLAEAALAGAALVTISIVVVGPGLLAAAAAPFFPIVAILLLTAATYFLIQAYTEGPDCIAGGNE